MIKLVAFYNKVDILSNITNGEYIMAFGEIIAEQTVKNFIKHFKSLSEGEQFKLGALFNKETGGKLSPYNSPTPVAVAVIQIQDGDEIKLLGVVRGIMPKIGEIAFPGGFYNTLEGGKAAAARETLEETGLVTKPEDYEYVGDEPTPNNNNLAFFKNKNIFPKTIMDTLVLNSEVTGFVLIDRDTPMAFPLHRQIADKFFGDTPKKRLKM